MWLLDKNVPVQLVDLLRKLGIESLNADQEGWGALTNGDLVSHAAAAGITCILTRDRLFGQSAAKVLKVHVSLAVVVVTLPQLRAPAFLEAFEREQSLRAINPIPGQVIYWPETSAT